MHDLFDESSGKWQPLDLQWKDFEKNFRKTRKPGFWKLERRQTFQEPATDRSWAAFLAGEWDKALQLNEARRDDLVRYYRRIAEYGFTTRRVRIVEQPITAYLQWELHALRLRDELGGRVRIVRSEQVEKFETKGPLPEISTLGLDIMYQAMYDDDGTFNGAFKFVDKDLIARCQKFIENLYLEGEDLVSFFNREIALLEPPGGDVVNGDTRIWRAG
jgi:hypothetical protein